MALAGRRAGDAHHERQVRDEPVRDAEDDRPQRPGPAGSVPRLRSARRAGLPTVGLERPSLIRRQISACSRSSAAIASVSGLRWAS